MDVGIRFWNSDGGLVETRYYDSQFLRRPNVENLFKLPNLFHQSFGQLITDKLLHLAMHGASVNLLVLEMSGDKLEADNFARILHIGSCAQHIINEALKEGIHRTDWNLDKLLKSLF